MTIFLPKEDVLHCELTCSKRNMWMKENEYFVACLKNKWKLNITKQDLFVVY